MQIIQILLYIVVCVRASQCALSLSAKRQNNMHHERTSMNTGSSIYGTLARTTLGRRSQYNHMYSFSLKTFHPSLLLRRSPYSRVGKQQRGPNIVRTQEEEIERDTFGLGSSGSKIISKTGVKMNNNESVTLYYRQSTNNIPRRGFCFLFAWF